MCSFSWCSGSSRGRTTGPPIRRCLPALGTTGGHPSYVPTDPSLAAGPPTRVEPRRKGFPKNSHPAYPAGVVPGRQGKENTPRQGGRGRQAGRQPTTPLQERTPKNKPTRQEERRERGEEEKNQIQQGEGSPPSAPSGLPGRIWAGEEENQEAQQNQVDPPARLTRRLCAGRQVCACQHLRPPSNPRETGLFNGRVCTHKSSPRRLTLSRS